MNKQNPGIGTCDETWNPVTGCLHTPEQCAVWEQCFARKVANKLRGRFGYDVEEPFSPKFHAKRLLEPCKVKKPQRIFACYDGKTEVLTEDGWKLIKDITFNDRVAVPTENTFELKYELPTGLLKKRYKGKMYRLQTKTLNLMVTPDHNMVVAFKENAALKDRDSWHFQRIPAKDIYGKQVFYKRNLIWKGKEIKTFVLPGQYIERDIKKDSRGRQSGGMVYVIPPVEIPIADWLDFLGLYLAEGCPIIGKKDKSNRKVVLSTDNKDPNQKHVIVSAKKIAKLLGRKINVDRHGRVTIHDKRLTLYFKELNLDGALKKFIPKEFKQLSPRLLKILLHSMVSGDGHDKGTKKWSNVYSTSSKKLADDVQEIALKSGYVSTIGIDKRDDSHKNKRGRLIKRTSPGYWVSIGQVTTIPEIWSKKRKQEIERWVDYDDYVYCIEVPSHIIYVRRNGKPVWCGNCDMSDLFGDWVKREWISSILGIVKQCPQHTFQFLTKNPKRYYEFRFPRNVWLGTTVNSQADAGRIDMIRSTDASVRYLYLEPLYGPIEDSFEKIDWIIIGAQTDPYRPPEKEWVEQLLDAFDGPIFLKSNLKWPETREEFPEVVLNEN